MAAMVLTRDERMQRCYDEAMKQLSESLIDKLRLRERVDAKELTEEAAQKQLEEAMTLELEAMGVEDDVRGDLVPPPEMKVSTNLPVGIICDLENDPAYQPASSAGIGCQRPPEAKATSSQPSPETLDILNQFVSGPAASDEDRADPSHLAYVDGDEYEDPDARVRVIDGKLCIAFCSVKQARYWSFQMNARCFAGEGAGSYYSQNMGDFKHFRLPQTLMLFFNYVAQQRIVACADRPGLLVVAFDDKVGRWEEGFPEEPFHAWVARVVRRFHGGYATKHEAAAAREEEHSAEARARELKEYRKTRNSPREPPV